MTIIEEYEKLLTKLGLKFTRTRYLNAQTQNVGINQLRHIGWTIKYKGVDFKLNLSTGGGQMYINDKYTVKNSADLMDTLIELTDKMK